MSKNNVATFIFFIGMGILIFGGMEWISTSIGALVVILAFIILNMKG